MAFAVKTDVTKSGQSSSQNTQDSTFKYQKRDRPYCTHCKILGHTMDRCYKIHGYPPRYKFRSNNNHNAAAHQVSTSDGNSDQSNAFGGQVSDPFPDLVLPHPALQTHFVPDLLSSHDQDFHVPSDVPADSISPIASSSGSSLPPSSIGAPIAVIPALVPSSSDHVGLRKSTRLIQQPTYLKDYHCNLLTGSSTHTSSSTAYPISDFMSYHDLSASHKHFVLSVSSHVEPQYYHQAVKVPEWRLAMPQWVNLSETEDQQVARYVGGLRSEIQDLLNLQMLWSLSEAVNFAYKIEMQLKRPSRSTNATGKQSSIQKPQQKQDKSKDQGMQGAPHFRNNRTSNNPYAKPFPDKCFRCQQPGHLSNECPSCRQVNMMDDVDSLDEQEDDCEEAEFIEGKDNTYSFWWHDKKIVLMPSNEDEIHNASQVEGMSFLALTEEEFVKHVKEANGCTGING
ncbi:hypothetical protein LWI29_001815 [Acer saccharum]|uniref:CCHC-type domain-containing protein n=1 Tax=Acer saccharum TaxID=4024 RepID=A0AA39SGG1_ACESA|nr:hypothetical protein LWI29_001815 [Acer saccharum]